MTTDMASLRSAANAPPAAAPSAQNQKADGVQASGKEVQGDKGTGKGKKSKQMPTRDSMKRVAVVPQNQPQSQQNPSGNDPKGAQAPGGTSGAAPLQAPSGSKSGIDPQNVNWIDLLMALQLDDMNMNQKEQSVATNQVEAESKALDQQSAALNDLNVTMKSQTSTDGWATAGMLIATAVCGAVGSMVGSVIFPGVGTVAGAAIGAFAADKIIGTMVAPGEEVSTAGSGFFSINYAIVETNTPSGNEQLEDQGAQYSINGRINALQQNENTAVSLHVTNPSNNEVNMSNQLSQDISIYGQMYTVKGGS